jgi:hypothetical protein
MIGPVPQIDKRRDLRRAAEKGQAGALDERV